MWHKRRKYDVFGPDGSLVYTSIFESETDAMMVQSALEKAFANGWAGGEGSNREQYKTWRESYHKEHEIEFKQLEEVKTLLLDACEKFDWWVNGD